MRLLHLIDVPRHSGAEILVRDLCTVHNSMEIRTAVAALAPSAPAFQVELDNLRAAGTELWIPDTPLRGVGRARAYAAAIREFRPDVILAHCTIPAIYGRLAAAVSAASPKIAIVLHSATNDYLSPKLRWAEKLLQPLTHAVVAVGTEVRDSYPAGRPEGIRLIPNGVNVARFADAALEREAHRVSLGLSPDQKMILQIGRINRTKQQLHVLQSAAELLHRHPHWSLWFAGISQDEDYEAEIARTIDSLGLSRQARLLGARSDVAELLAAADLYVMPSRAEAHPIALLEGLASGAPVVGSDIESFRFARDMPGVALAALDENLAPYIERMIGAPRCSRIVPEYDIQHVAERYAALCRELLSPKGPRRPEAQRQLV